ncbi:hypothetical protein F4810DRAFT_720503 [Camillea tinctor]|nr:hypothetical protein F4810DRAFT_720503 [Camillea tinctor]
MRSNKDRLYIALYARGGTAKMPGQEDKYHWAFIIGPKVEPREGGQGVRFHAMESLTSGGESSEPHSMWAYDESTIALRATKMLLARVVIAKIKDVDRLKSVFQSTPIRPEVPGWNCVGWVEEAFRKAMEDGDALGRAADSWKAVRDAAMWYVEKKKSEHRFDGQRQYDQSKAATWDIFQGKEITP